jgi:hypothetical protein
MHPAGSDDESTPSAIKSVSFQSTITLPLTHIFLFLTETLPGSLSQRPAVAFVNQISLDVLHCPLPFSTARSQKKPDDIVHTVVPQLQSPGFAVVPSSFTHIGTVAHTWFAKSQNKPVVLSQSCSPQEHA